MRSATRFSRRPGGSFAAIAKQGFVGLMGDTIHRESMANREFDQ
jgi:hypothetical protein